MDTPRLLSQELPFGKLYLVTDEYQEFVCSRSTLSWLQAGGMQTVDGKQVYVVEKEPCPGGNVVGGYYFTTHAD